MGGRAALLLLLSAGLAVMGGSAAIAQTDPLPSWNDGPIKHALQ